MGPCDTIAIVADNCPEFVVALFGVVSVGAAAAPVNPGLAAPRMSSTLAAVQARAAIVPSHLYDAFTAMHQDAARPAWELSLGPAQGGHLPPAALARAAARAVPLADHPQYQQPHRQVG